MNKKKYLEKIKSQINLNNFLMDHTEKHINEKKKIQQNFTNVLESMVLHPDNLSEHVINVNNLFKEIWKKYDCEQISGFFKEFLNIEPALLSIGGARDHYLHLIHVYIFGLRVISQIIRKVGNSSEILKVKDESEQYCVFKNAYSFKERIFYIWTLSSTFHDIAYPFEYLPKIEKGLNRYAEYINFSVSPLIFLLDYSDLIDLDYYFHLISDLCGGNLEFEEIDALNKLFMYKKKKNSYLHKVLLYAFRERNHGIIGSLILFRIIEQNFLLSKNKLEGEEFNRYIDYYFKDDIARMALIIALHHLKSKNIPPTPKVKFSRFPLLFILILADELQEFIRKQVESGKEYIILKKIPDIKFKNNKNFSIKIIYYLDEDEIKEITKLSKSSDPKKAIEDFWRIPTDTLKLRLDKESMLDVSLKIIREKDDSNLFKWELS